MRTSVKWTPSPDSNESPRKRRRKVITKKDKCLVLETIRQHNLESLVSRSLETTKAKLQVHGCNLVRSLSTQLKESELCFVTSFLKELFINTYEKCSKGKNKYISFQFQWHMQCCPLLVEKATDLSSVNVFPGDQSTEAVQMVRKQWIGLYIGHGSNSDAAKIVMLVFLSEVYKELLSRCHDVLKPVSPVQGSASCDPVDVYYRFGGATLVSMLHNCYEIMKSGTFSQKERTSNEIHILQRLVATDKSQAPEYLKYRDEGHMYLPCEELLPFLKEVDVAIKSIANKEGFEKHGKKLVEVTVSSISKDRLRGYFQNALAHCFSNPEELPSSAVSRVFETLVSKLCNTRIQEFIDSFKHAAARKQEAASISGQNLCDKLLTHHTNLKHSNTSHT